MTVTQNIEATDTFCPRCGSSQSDQVVAAQFNRDVVKTGSLAVIAVGFCMIPLAMGSPGISAIVPVISSIFITGGLSVYVWSKFGAWWQ